MTVLAMLQQKAFTLIELMLVLLIMAVFAGAIMPSMSRAFRGAGLKATGEKLCETLQFAYASAVSRKRPVMVNMDLDRRRCWVTLHAVSLPWLDGAEDAAEDDKTLINMEWPEKIRVTINQTGETQFPSSEQTASWEVITFHSDGRSSDILIELANEEDEPFEIEILGTTGQVRMRKRDAD